MAGSDVMLKITLLQRKDELLLSEHFADSLRHVRKKGSSAAPRLSMVNFDWHGAIKELHEEGTVHGLWSILAAILPEARPCAGAAVCGFVSAVMQMTHSWTSMPGHGMAARMT